MKPYALLALAALWWHAFALPQSEADLIYCGEARYLPSRYTCYEGNFLCPVINGVPTLKCGMDCYLPDMYSCSNDRLVYPPVSATSSSPSTATGTTSASPTGSTACPTPATQLQLSDPPYENYFYSDCHASNQVVITSPLPDSNLTIIGPRLLVAWPAGNSGVVAFFEPQNGVNGSLTISLENSTTTGQPLAPVYSAPSSAAGNPLVGVQGYIRLNSPAVLDVAILGSIRTIRDFTEGPSILIPQIQNAINFDQLDGGAFSLSRRWLDNETMTYLNFAPSADDDSASITLNNRTLEFEAGLYLFSASFDYPQLDQLSPEEVLNPASRSLIAQNPDQAVSLSFLSYTTKLLAGAWRFLTYFGRDSMISALLLQPVLSEGENGAMEAVISAVLERINSTDGSVAHEETLGDYATYLNLQNNVTSTAPIYDYKMIDTDFFLPVLMRAYFVDTIVGRERTSAFFETTATVDPANEGLSYADLALISAEKIVNSSAAFASAGGQTTENLIHLKEGQIVGQWRDSTYGIGGGRIPYDVNTALVPAALRAIAALSAAGFFPEHPDWNETAARYAQVWEDETLQFFQVTIQPAEARDLVESYVEESGFPGPVTQNITSDVTFYGLALEGNNDQPLVRVMNTDDCFRLFLVNSTNQTQLSVFLDQAARHVMDPFPIGLSTSVGLVVANPAYGGDPVYAANFTNNAYHGTVVWGWQLAMMARGLELQLDRCNPNTGDVPDYCADTPLYGRVRAAYNHLWDLLEQNEEYLSSEVWSWVFENGDYVYTPLGSSHHHRGRIRRKATLDSSGA
ncbi:hypothetical protein H2199_007413 [Coniosporium tulheliwenetii]|uniref:Uncharacterized protein n=1 Tax=Coniosporium tulheliwenetii TaxID=3383036 RepID=A0ACC2YPE7_9PEZI|nr:hypothetical protein H2199_007413 [Cladosporium sp. JES 115]